MDNKICVNKIIESKCKSDYAKKILERLPEWFGNMEALNDYVQKVKELPFWAASDKENNCIGFFAIKNHYEHTAEIVVCGVLPEYHRMGIGKAIYKEVEEHFLKLAVNMLL